MIFKSLTQKALNISRILKRLLAIILDCIFCIFATWMALSLRLDNLIIFDLHYFIPALISITIAIPVFFFLGFYKVIFRYETGDTLKILAKAIILYALIYSIICVVITIENIPRSVGLIQPMILFLMIGTSRWLVRVWIGHYFSYDSNMKLKKGVIIYGAGNSGRQLASNLVHSNEFKLLFFIDDNKNFWGGTIDGYLVKSPSIINKFKDKNPKELWLAMPKLSSLERKNLISRFKEFPLHVRTLPSFSDLTNGKVYLSDLRELDINELLGRNAVKPNSFLLRKCISEKTVLVTGAGGSIGAELCRQILTNNPKCVLLAEHSEVALYNIHTELISINRENSKHKNFKEIILVPLLVNILDEKKMDHIFKIWKPNTVYHAAAYKHVPMVEYNVVSGITNNFLGTLSCAKVAMKHKVNYFVLISTDKAVRPTNIMGASKRLAEMTLQLFNYDKKNSHTSFCIVRFGNVLGSSGSVVPLFRKQIQNGGPITLTDNNVTRYFMTITEAAQLVIQAGAMSKGAEVFLLDMGKPVKIADLARKMIESSGLQVKDKYSLVGDIEIQVTGLRPGEKLYEELLIDSKSKSTLHSRIFQAIEPPIPEKEFNLLVKQLILYLKQNNIKEIKNLLKNSVSGYVPNSSDVDWISNFNKKNDYNSIQKF